MMFVLFDDKKIEMNFKPDEPIINIYIKISEKIGIRINFLRLIYNGLQLDCNKRLSYYNIGPYANIRLLGKLLCGETHQKKCMWL